jgi:hypothetical protein
VRHALGCRSDRIKVAAIAAAHLGPVVNAFAAVMYLNQGTRGPLSGRADGSWRTRFVSALLPETGVAAVAPSVSCQLVPHMQTHMYAVSTLVVPILIAYELTVSDAERHNRIGHVAHACRRCCCRLRVERANALVLLPSMTILY